MASLLRLLHALRPLLTPGWSLGAVFAFGFLAMQRDAWQIVVRERQPSTLTCAALAAAQPRPGWVRLSECHLKSGERIALRRGLSPVHRATLVPLFATQAPGASPVVHVLVEHAPGDAPYRLENGRVSGLLHPVSGYRAGPAFDMDRPVLHVDEPAIGSLALSVLPAAGFVAAFARRWRREWRAGRVREQLRAGVHEAAPGEVVDLSALLGLRSALACSLPCWALTALLAGLASSFGLAGAMRAVPGLLALAVVVAGCAAWDRCRPSTLAAPAGLAPVACIGLGAYEALAAPGADERLMALALAGYGLFALLMLMAALHRLHRDPARPRLLGIERAWHAARRWRGPIPGQPGKARRRSLALHGAGLLLGGVTSLLLALAGGGGIGVGIGIAVFFALRQRARRHGLPTAAESQQRDGRPPILYLRSFLDEDRMLSSRAYQREVSISEWAAAQFSRLGPVIAIARPGERLPPIGPCRIELPADGDWQREVQQRIDRSAAVLLLFGMTPGLLWELQQIAGRGAVQRMVLVFPPIDAIDLAQRWRQLDDYIAAIPALGALRSIDPNRLLMAAIGRDGRLQAVCASSRTRASYEAAAAAMLLERSQDATASSTAPV